jgi:hypothetical protein
MAEFTVYLLQALQVGLVIFGAFYLYYDWKLGVAAVPSSTAAVSRVAALLRELPGRQVADLGSGWGGMALAAGKACPDKEVTGIEYAPMPYLWSRMRLLCRPHLRNVRFLRRDLFAYDLSQTDIVFCYMPPEFMPRLAAKFAELPKGALVISNSAVAEGLIEERRIPVAGLLPETIHLYRVA